MIRLALTRHGQSSANSAGILAGRAPGVHLDDRGRAQAAALGERFAGVPIAAIVHSPLERCVQTAKAIAARQPQVRRYEDPGLTECDYGRWTSRSLAELSGEPLWRSVLDEAETVTFPGGEAMVQMQQRTVQAMLRWVARLDGVAGTPAGEQSASGGAHELPTIVVVTHADPIKALIAHALGQPLRHFQRLVVHPGSVSVLQYGGRYPYLLALNDTCHVRSGDGAPAEGIPVDAAGDGGAGDGGAGRRGGQ